MDLSRCFLLHFRVSNSEMKYMTRTFTSGFSLTDNFLNNKSKCQFFEHRQTLYMKELRLWFSLACYLQCSQRMMFKKLDEKFHNRIIIECIWYNFLRITKLLSMTPCVIWLKGVKFRQNRFSSIWKLTFRFTVHLLYHYEYSAKLNSPTDDTILLSASTSR